jgi:hypothetical protein
MRPKMGRKSSYRRSKAFSLPLAIVHPTCRSEGTPTRRMVACEMGLLVGDIRRGEAQRFWRSWVAKLPPFQV